MIRGRIGATAHHSISEKRACRARQSGCHPGEIGFGYVLGRDSQKAELIALCDALIQNDALAIAVEQKIVTPLRGA
jgi:alpha-D-ribose 1-methylphosphonate 5-triphosphate synthase subunit PhnG